MSLLLFIILGSIYNTGGLGSFFDQRKYSVLDWITSPPPMPIKCLKSLIQFYIAPKTTVEWQKENHSWVITVDVFCSVSQMHCCFFMVFGCEIVVLEKGSVPACRVSFTSAERPLKGINNYSSRAEGCIWRSDLWAVCLLLRCALQILEFAPGNSIRGSS